LTCLYSLEPGWLWMPGGDYVQCPNCIKGWVSGHETVVHQTRKIILPARVS
jgi:hypothetical protein